MGHVSSLTRKYICLNHIYFYTTLPHEIRIFLKTRNQGAAHSNPVKQKRFQNYLDSLGRDLGDVETNSSVLRLRFFNIEDPQQKFKTSRLQLLRIR